MSSELPDAIDLSHHLSQIARRRALSPLKGYQKYWGKPGIISLAGGLPSPEYFPFTVISGEILPHDYFSTEHSDKAENYSWFWRLFGRKKQSRTVSVPKYPDTPEDLSLSTALQYSLARGLPQLEDFVHTFTATIHKPAYRNFGTIAHDGNTDGWAKIMMTLCDPGQGVLLCEWTYASALAEMVPCGVKPVPVAMDSQGMRSDALRDVLLGWDDTARGMSRPHVLYTVPIGQNPTGTTMGHERKKAIYDICVEFDVIIVEDDPYYFLQEGPYLPPAERKNSRKEDSEQDDAEYFLSQLAPSFLRFDYQGRVVRLDSFSKTIAPGSRLGWFTCHPVFMERLERQAETSTQAPCGFGQSMIISLLSEWKIEGYIRWLRGLRMQYTQRRDFFVDCLRERFDLAPTVLAEGIWTGCNVYVAKRKHRDSLEVEDKKGSSESHALFSFVPPMSGMFVWLQMHFEHHPLFPSHGSKALETKLWLALAEAGLLLAAGDAFAGSPEVQLRSDLGHFRLSFSQVEPMDLNKALDIFASVLESFYET